MQTPEDVQGMLKLASLGWGAKRIAAELGCSRNTVRHYLRQGGWQPYRAPPRGGCLDQHAHWLAERFLQHRGNCDVVRQDLRRELGLQVSLRTVERAVAHLRGQVLALSTATIRFETPPGHQLQIDFGSVRVSIGSEVHKVHLFVATLGYSRRTYVAAFLHERQSAWLQGLEGAFGHFGGLTRELLLDNAKALVEEHDVQTREVRFNDRFHEFCRYWDVLPRACAPYRPRTKGKDERGVGYVKRNAIAGHHFDSFEDLHGHLDQWMRDVADIRIHGTTGEPPIGRFEREERAALRVLPAKAPFLQVRELTRRVHSDACVELDTNRYSVPWRLIGESVTVSVADGQVRIHYAGQEVASHAQSVLRRQTLIERTHLAGIVGAHLAGAAWLPRQTERPASSPPAPELLRPLQEYERVLGGAW
ncbi:IS21 family transposase [Ramlibacter alkalitolerans]|uniref:IS21 family transposase n=1 Tax=Ramlibacter alkalitolerans TaxID=2039631 RepID=A0ABS1JX22_9BURK|nr:IS21 family transposase [Ramlibacter alkalitolerans]MBL0428873.1 IS21 family transposase [Ramlibacter alkalitolerans]